MRFNAARNQRRAVAVLLSTIILLWLGQQLMCVPYSRSVVSSRWPLVVGSSSVSIRFIVSSFRPEPQHTITSGCRQEASFKITVDIRVEAAVLLCPVKKKNDRPKPAHRPPELVTCPVRRCGRKMTKTELRAHIVSCVSSKVKPR